MDFDTAFDRLMGHEGGYVNVNSQSYVNFSCLEHGKHKYADCTANIDSDSKSYKRGEPTGFFDFCSAIKFPRLWLFRTGLRSTSLRVKTMQCALPTRSKRKGVVCTGKGKKARGIMCRVRNGFRSKGRVGAVSETLPQKALHNNKRRGRQGIRREMLALPRFISKSGFRLSSQIREAGLSELSAREQLTLRDRQGTSEVRSSLCELSSFGAWR